MVRGAALRALGEWLRVRNGFSCRPGIIVLERFRQT